MMKRIKILIVGLMTVVIAGAGLMFSGCSLNRQRDYFLVGIVSGSARLPAFELASAGFRKQLAYRLAGVGQEGRAVRFVYRTASGDNTLATAIADGFIAQGVDLMFSLGTGASNAALTRADVSGTPLVWGMITDPVGEGLITPISTGAAGVLPASTKIDLLQELVGGELNANRRIAYIYTLREDNSVAIRDQLLELAPQGIVPFVNSSAECFMPIFISIAADPTIAAIYVGQVDEIVSVMQLMQNLNVASPRPVPITSVTVVDVGAVVSIAVCFYANGQRAADIAFDVLMGERDVSDIPFYRPTIDSLALRINKEEAEAIGFTIPETLLRRMA